MTKSKSRSKRSNQNHLNSQSGICLTEALEPRVLLSGGQIFLLYAVGGRDYGGNLSETDLSGSGGIGALNTNSFLPQGMALSGSDLFMVNGDVTPGPNNGLNSGSVIEYTTSGEMVNQSLISGLYQPGGIAASGSDLFLMNGDANGGFISEYSTTGTLVNAELIPNLNSAEAITLSGSDLFILNGDSSGGEYISEYTTSGALVNPSIVTLASPTNSFAVSGSDLFVLDHIGGTVGEYTTSGATVNASLITGLSNPTPGGIAISAKAIAVSGSEIFVVDSSVTMKEFTTSGAPISSLENNSMSYIDLIIVSPQVATTEVSSQLQFESQPTDVNSGQNIASPAITVALEDQNGIVVAGDSPNISLSIASGPAGATLEGTTTAQAVDGLATFTNITLSESGTYTLTASDGSDTSSSSSTFTVTAIPTHTTLASSAPSATSGQSVTFTATVAPENSNAAVPAGTFTFTDGAGNVLETAPVQNDGKAVFSTSFLSAQTHNITATYSGDNLYAPSDSSLTETITAPPASPATVIFGRAVIPASVVAGAPFVSTLPVAISNSSTNLKGRFSLDLYADPVTDGNGRQILIGALHPNLGIRKAKHKSIAFHIKTLPTDLPGGQYNLVAEVTDPNGTSVWATSSSVFQVIVPIFSASLSISKVQPSSISPGHLASAMVSIVNTGNIALSDPSLTLSVFVLQSAAPGTALITSVRNVTIEPGKTRKLRINFRIPKNLGAGTYLPFANVVIDGITDSATGTTPFTIK